MTDPVDRVMEEVWEWKRQAEQATSGMSAAEVIEFYRKRAEEVQRKFGLDPVSQPAAEAAPTRRRP